jgi:hypothetical protein
MNKTNKPLWTEHDMDTLFHHDLFCKFPDKSVVKLKSAEDLNPHYKMSNSNSNIYKHCTKITWINSMSRIDTTIVPSEWVFLGEYDGK